MSEPTGPGPPTGARALDAELLDLPSADGFEAFEQAILDRTGAVAVVGAPFSGRDAVVDHATERLENCERVSLSAGDDPPTIPDDGALVVAGCHHLYERRIGGFDRLNTFLSRVTETDALVVAGWSRSALAYLEQVTPVTETFPIRFPVPSLDAEGVAALLRTRWESGDRRPTFISDPAPAGPVVETERHTVELWRGRTIAFPRPHPNWEAIDQLTSDDTDPETAVFERLAARSDGNPGVAIAIWERSVRDGEVAPSYVDDPIGGLDLSLDAAFALRVVLSKEATTRDELTAVVGPAADRHVSTLARAGLVDTDGRVRMRPEAVPAASTHLDRRRLP